MPLLCWLHVPIPRGKKLQIKKLLVMNVLRSLAGDRQLKLAEYREELLKEKLK
jgi:hypothetical protein